MDWELLDKLSRDFPEASIVVVGRVREAGGRALVGGVLAVPARPERPRAGLAPAGGDRAILSGFRRLLDPLPHRPSVQPGVQPDQDHGRDGLGPPDRRHRDTGMPAACRAFHVVENADEFTAAVREILGRHSDDGRPACGTRLLSPTHATGWASGFWN